MAVVNADASDTANAQEFLLIKQLDERTCPICGEWVGLRGPLSTLPSIPADSRDGSKLS